MDKNMKMKGSATAYLLLVLLLLAGGYLINKGIISVNLDKVNLPTTTTLSNVVPTSSSIVTNTSTTISKEPICTKNGTDLQMGLGEAENIALHSECGKPGLSKDIHSCNKVTGTWWIDLDIQKKGCKPACVINIETKKAKINWRCTGLLPLPPE